MFSQKTYAQTIDIPIPSPTATPSATPEINYALPYPGLLPGNPLYTFKAIRDKITEVMTTNPLKKANFYLLQADKRLSSALIMHEKGDKEQAENTISKGQNYLEKSIDKTLHAKESQESIIDITAKLKSSAEKHELEISKLIKNSDGEVKKKLENDLKRAKDLKNRAHSIKP
jgi:uncharacterized membrane protein YheB (UPF0754 family)